jgi:hypothetical protein
MRLGFSLLLALGLFAQTGSRSYFVPTDRVSGIGVDRDDVSPELLEARTDLMIQTQTFTIMREPQAVAGAKRVTGDSKLQGLIRAASAKSGFPAETLEAIMYLESWGDPRAESPAGPRGIMQISEATARVMGLQVKQARRYRVSRERVAVPGKGKKPRFKTVTTKIPYYTIVRDDRLTPSRAIPAAANYLAGMERKFGGRDWAVFGYHCGQGCAGRMLDLTRTARGVRANEVTVSKMFFAGSPVWNRELYEAVELQMQRDYSPTYWFRIMRAQQLLSLYRRNPREFELLAEEYRAESSRSRAPHRLAVWLKRGDILFRSPEDIRSATAARLLVRAFNRPDYFGYSLRPLASTASAAESYDEAAPSAIGALTYIAFETRRLYEALNPLEDFRPLDVVSLVTPDDGSANSQREVLEHGSGQVFDLDYSRMPAVELQCLRFVLNDLGWAGYLGFIEEGPGILHVGSAPSARDFFTRVFQQAAGFNRDGSGDFIPTM